MSHNGSEPAATDVTALFIVVIDLEGQSKVILDPEARFTAHRLATAKDVYGALANALADYQAIKTAEAVMSFQVAMAQNSPPIQEADVE